MSFFKDFTVLRRAALMAQSADKAEYQFMETPAFTSLVDEQVARISHGHAGVLAVEVQTVIRHFETLEMPGADDFALLRAVTLVVSGKYHVEALIPFAAAASHTDMLALVRDCFFDAGAGKPVSWRQALRDAAARLEKQELETDPLMFLAEWIPDDPRLDAEKQQLLGNASFKTLTALFMMLIERELDLIERGAPAYENPPEDPHILWHGIGDTRDMRQTVEAVWCRHSTTPKDYAAAVHGKNADVQWAFLEPRRATLFGLR